MRSSVVAASTTISSYIVGLVRLPCVVMSKGIDGLIMKAWRADEYQLTVTSVRGITDKYHRVGFSAGNLLRSIDHFRWNAGPCRVPSSETSMLKINSRLCALSPWS